MNNLDDQIDTLYAKIAELDELIEFVFIDDTSLIEKRDVLFEQVGVLMEAKTIQSLFDTSQDYGTIQNKDDYNF